MWRSILRCGTSLLWRCRCRRSRLLLRPDYRRTNPKYAQCQSCKTTHPSCSAPHMQIHKSPQAVLLKTLYHPERSDGSAFRSTGEKADSPRTIRAERQRSSDKTCPRNDTLLNFLAGSESILRISIFQFPFSNQLGITTAPFRAAISVPSESRTTSRTMYVPGFTSKLDFTVNPVRVSRS